MKVRGTADEVVEAHLNHGRNNLLPPAVTPEKGRFFTSLLLSTERTAVLNERSGLTSPLAC